jgi:hypothetical protein
MFEKFSPLEEYYKFVSSQMFRRGIIFWVCNGQQIENMS